MPYPMTLTLTLALFVELASPLAVSGSEDIQISNAHRENDGVLVHSVRSPYQSGKTAIRVLLPDQVERSRRYPVVYVLPVEPGDGTRWGDGLAEVMKHDLHNKHQFIVVAPTFFQLPWYADHPTKPEISQESYFTKVVLPFVEQTYPASTQPTDRLLLGFSKSGWGAWSLLLRHPKAFGRAAAWDAPLMMDRLGEYGTTDIFGTQENFERHRPADLLRRNVKMLRDEKRLILTGYGNFREHHMRMLSLLDELKISHEYRDGPQRKHDWHSGWMPETVELLVGKSAGAVEQQP
jgi:S-formylglutathione hydrolase FrmB